MFWSPEMVHKQRAIEQLLLRHDVDIFRLWKRFPEMPTGAGDWPGTDFIPETVCTPVGSRVLLDLGSSALSFTHMSSHFSSTLGLTVNTTYSGNLNDYRLIIIFRTTSPTYLASLPSWTGRVMLVGDYRQAGSGLLGFANWASNKAPTMTLTNGSRVDGDPTAISHALTAGCSSFDFSAAAQVNNGESLGEIGGTCVLGHEKVGCTSWVLSGDANAWANTFVENQDNYQFLTNLYNVAI